MLWILSWFLLAATAAAADPPLSKNGNLIQFHVLMRHGQRAPISIFPPHNHSSAWPRGYGHLTTEGLKQQYELGKWLRQRYGAHLLAEYPDFSQFYVQSTDVDRCLDSAQANLAALFYPTNSTEEFLVNVNYTPVAVHTVPKQFDTLLHIVESCPNMNKIADEDLFNGAKAQEVMNNNKDLIAYLKGKLNNSDIENLEHLDWIFDTFRIQKENDIDISDVMNDTIYNRLQRVENKFFALWADTDRLKRLRGGGGALVQKILNDMDHKIKNGSAVPNMYMYSAHDITVCANLQTLGVYGSNFSAPSYASAVIYELYQPKDKGADPYIKILYRNVNEDAGNHNSTSYMQVPQCKGQEGCTVSQLREALAHLLPGTPGLQGYEGCYTPVEEGLSFGSKLAILIVVPLVIVVGGAVVAFFVVRKYA